MPSRIYSDPLAGEVRFSKSARGRRVCIRVDPVRGVSVTLPRSVSYAEGLEFFLEKRAWVLRALQKLNRAREAAGGGEAATPELVERLRAEAKKQLPPRLAELAERYGFVCGRVFIKHNSSSWGSCSARGNINLNLNLVRLPGVLRDHVMLHELCHLRHFDHGERFHELLEMLDGDNLSRQTGQEAEALREAVRRSRAKYPVQHVLRQELKKFPVY